MIRVRSIRFKPHPKLVDCADIEFPKNQIFRVDTAKEIIRNTKKDGCDQTVKHILFYF